MISERSEQARWKHITVGHDRPRQQKTKLPNDRYPVKLYGDPVKSKYWTDLQLVPGMEDLHSNGWVLLANNWPKALRIVA